MTTNNAPQIYEIRDQDSARMFITQGLWLQRVMPPTTETVAPALTWAIELLSQGEPIPPIGFIADAGHYALGLDWQNKTKKQQPEIPNIPPALLSTYEDHVLGKLYGDWSFSNASDALRQYETEKEHALGLAFILRQFRNRSKFPGVELSPSILTTLRDEENPADVLSQGFESFQQEGLHPDLQPLYTGLIKATRRTAEVLSREDVTELEIGTALQKEGDRVAMRQALEAANYLESRLPPHRLRPLAGRQEVPTRVLDEDTYPVGGFSSLSNRGTIESLLHSQLAFIEDEGERPDLFEIKFLRDELLFYSRDENQFLRRRRTFVFAFYPDLIRQIRYKDRELPYQRGILLAGTIITIIDKMRDWLSDDALTFDLVFLKPDKDHEALTAERELLERRFQEQIANGTIQIIELADSTALEKHCAKRSRRSLCHCLAMSEFEQFVHAEDTVVTKLQINSPIPLLGDDRLSPTASDNEEEPVTCWSLALQEILQRWI